MTHPLHAVAGPTAPVEPSSYLRLTAREVDQLLERLEESVPVSPALREIPEGVGHEAVIFGDTHGDWRSTEVVARRFLERPDERMLIGLGDYVSRAPDDCAEGSVVNSLFLLDLASRYPDRVVLLQGNHETHRQIPVVPDDLPEEVDQLWGPDVERYARLVGLLERGRVAATTRSGVYLAHGGFPKAATPGDWRKNFESVSEDLLLDIVWGECGASRSKRGMGTEFTERELEEFLTRSGLHVFLRGHDPDLVGRPVFHDRCLTLHTSRTYERFGGVLCAMVPLDRPVRTTLDLRLEHLETEGKEFPVPP
ncbi:MAG: metallophosphoesterase [Thermoplasmata archaeon]|nr:metallophosphoesterase [Thermoplasmata archaeon]